jgi:Flp pilus assembly protein TadG
MRSSRSRKAAGRSRRARGAAMVEALVAIPFFIVIFVSILYIGHLYGEKQRTLREAKQGAWSYALNNCEGGSNATEQTDDNPQEALDSQGASSDSGDIDKYAPSSGGSSFLKSWGTAVYTVKGTVVADGLLGGFQNSLSTTDRVQCNEKPEDGTVDGVLKYGWSLISF